MLVATSSVRGRADHPRDRGRRTVLEAGIPIVEHLCSLRELPESGFRFTAVPAKVKGMGTFPVRAHAIVSR